MTAIRRILMATVGADLEWLVWSEELREKEGATFLVPLFTISLYSSCVSSDYHPATSIFCLAFVPVLVGLIGRWS